MKSCRRRLTRRAVSGKGAGYRKGLLRKGSERFTLSFFAWISVLVLQVCERVYSEMVMHSEIMTHNDGKAGEKHGGKGLGSEERIKQEIGCAWSFGWIEGEAATEEALEDETCLFVIGKRGETSA